ncbi:uncharacterized protein N7483_006619 [Penicillium malachiteum]|uniref:uncharacterized protein n=1 Tax=Penicillium malachiteum TaxID=1324776 RepID=UPI0025495BB4|nr:uncharacterized protein N7483_006619 [Penicillium malachiteum]KAJ5725262.1 hypothetical protein N7483_006619 [Penicillium malachiteum]
MFDKLKAKVDNFKLKHKHDRDVKALVKPHEDEVEHAHIPTPPPDNAGPSTRPEHRISSLETPKQEIEDVKDSWREALQSLPLEKQEALKAMGLDQLESGSVNFSFNDLVEIVNERQKECESKFWRISIPLGESEQMAALLGTTEKIVRIICRGQAYEEIYLNPKSQGSFDSVTKNLETGLIKIYATSLDILADAGTLFSKNTAQRTFEAIVNPEKASGALSDIDEQETQLLLDI